MAMVAGKRCREEVPGMVIVARHAIFSIWREHDVPNPRHLSGAYRRSLKPLIHHEACEKLRRYLPWNCKFVCQVMEAPCGCGRGGTSALVCGPYLRRRANSTLKAGITSSTMCWYSDGTMRSRARPCGPAPGRSAAPLRQSVSPAAMISSRPASRRQRATGICRNRRPATPNTFSNELSCNPVMRVTF
jgi:hypothetical protein